MLGRLSLAYTKFVRALAYIFALVAGVALLLMVVVTCIDVVGRTSTKALRIYDPLLSVLVMVVVACSAASIVLGVLRRLFAARHESLRMAHVAFVFTVGAAAFVLAAVVCFAFMQVLFDQGGLGIAARRAVGPLLLAIVCGAAGYGAFAAVKRADEPIVRSMLVGLVASAAFTLAVFGVVALLVLTNRLSHRLIVGIYDIVIIAGTLTIACALPYTTAVKGHIAIEYFFLKLPRGGKVVVDTLARLVGMAFFTLLAWQSLQYGRGLKTVGQVSQTLKIPIFWVPYVIAASCAVVVLIIFNHLLHPGRETIKP